MTGPTATGAPGGAPGRVLPGRRAASPLRSGTAVAAGAGIVSLAGFLTWIVAARSMPTAQVGQLQGFVNAFMLVSGAGQLGIGLVLTRYLPTAGRAAARVLLIADALLVASVLATTGIFLLTPFADTVGAGLRHPGLVLAALTVLWSLYSLQAQVLPAIDRAGWSLPTSLAFSVLRLGLLWLLAGHGVAAALVSWWVPCLLTVLVVGVLVHRRGLAAHRARPAQVPRLRRAAGYAAGNWLASLWGTVYWSGLPLLVLHLLGPAVSAVFGVLHVLVQTVDNLAGRYGAQLIILAATDRDGLARHTRTLVRGALLLVLPGLALLALLAPLLLHAFGSHYARAGTTPMRIMIGVLALRLVQQLVVNLWRATDRTVPVVLVHVVQVVPVIALLATGAIVDLTGVATALLLTQVVLSAALLPTLVRFLRPPRAGTAVDVPTPRARQRGGA